MKNLNEYIKEGLFDDVDKLEGENGLNNNIDRLKDEITEYIKKLTRNLQFTIDMNTTPPTVNPINNVRMHIYIPSL